MLIGTNPGTASAFPPGGASGQVLTQGLAGPGWAPQTFGGGPVLEPGLWYDNRWTASTSSTTNIAATLAGGVLWMPILLTGAAVIAKLTVYGLAARLGAATTITAGLYAMDPHTKAPGALLCTGPSTAVTVTNGFKTVDLAAVPVSVGPGWIYAWFYTPVSFNLMHHYQPGVDP